LQHGRKQIVDSKTLEFSLLEPELSPEGRAFVAEIDVLAEEVLAEEPENSNMLFIAPPTPKGAKRLRVTTHAFFAVSVVMCLLLSVTMLLNQFSHNGIGGLRFFVESTDAMKPNISHGALLVTIYRPPAKIAPGDIITYYAVRGERDTRLTRVVVSATQKNGNYVYVTRRAAAETPDSIEINQTYVLGVKLFAVPGAGYVISFVRTYAWAFAITAAALCVAAVLLRRWLKEQENLIFVDKRPIGGRKLRVAS
jgi:hypothetical protein